MTWGLVVAGVGAAVGGIAAANSAKGAANTQAASADKATQAQLEATNKTIDFQREAMNKQIELQQPFRDLGLNAQNKLSFLLGLTPSGYNTNDPEIQKLRAQLAPQFTKDLGGGSSVEDTWALDAAVKAALQKNAQKQDGYGSLLQDFTEAPPAVADFSTKDFQADPGYQFRMDEGQKALERSAAARGGLFSGRAMKDTLRFAQGLGSQEYGNAFSRYQTNRGNKVADWQNRLNLFNINRTNKLQPLQSLGGVAQSATNQMAGAAQNFGQGAGNATMNYGQAVGSNLIGAGNAQAASQIAQGNAYQNAIGQGMSMYQNNQLMNRLIPQGTSYGSFGASPMSSLLYSNGSLGD